MIENKSLRRNITIFPFFNFFRSFRLTGAIFYIYLASKFNSYTLAMSYISMIMIFSALFEVPSGIFSDKIGRKKTLALGSVFVIAESLIYIIADGSQSYFFYIISALFFGLSMAFFSGTDDALLYETASQLKKSHKFHHIKGKMQSFVLAALGVSALLGSIIAEFSFLIVFYIQFSTQLIALIFSLFLIEPRDKKTNKSNPLKHFFTSLKLITKDKKLRNLTIGKMIDDGATTASGEFRQLFLSTIIPVWLIGVMHFFNRTFGTLSFWFAGKIIDKFNNLKVIIYSSVINKIIITIGILLSSILSPFLFILSSCVWSPYKVAFSNLIQKEFKSEQRATMGSIISLGKSMILATLSMISGVFADLFGVQITMLILILIGVVGTKFYYSSYDIKFT